MDQARAHFMTGYQAVAATYEQTRPSYPSAAIDCLVSNLAITPTSTVLDLAAGTGKLTRLLAPRAGRLVAVEPVAAMRSTLEAAVPGARVLEGTAEAIPLGTDSVDSAVVGQAFHWFDGPRAAGELARVLRPRGRLGLIWNQRDESTEAQERIAALLSRYRGSSLTFKNSGWQSTFTDSPVFDALEMAVFPNVHPLSKADLIGLIMSMSYMPGLSDRDRQSAIAEAGAIFDDVAGDQQQILLAYDTRVYWAAAI
ncbi:MAG: class I SAM-dependent methyltransferase [Acidimicrobiia bacterium]